MRVAVIGLRWDGSARMVRALVEAGHDVTALHIGSTDGSPVPEERERELPGVQGRFRLLDPQDRTYNDDLEIRGWPAVADELTDVDAVVLGRWHGWLAHGVGEQAVAWAASTSTSLIVMEASCLTVDDTITGFSPWIAEHDAAAQIRFVRDDDPDFPFPPMQSFGTSDGGLPALLTTLAASGYESTSPTIAQEQAETLRDEYGIPTVGLRWEEAGWVGGDQWALRIAGTRDGLRSGDPRGVDWFPPEGIPAVVMNGFNEEGDLVAVRLLGDTDAFAQKGCRTPVAVLTLPEGKLYVGPADTTSEEGVAVLGLSPGDWVLQLDDEPYGAQLFRAGPTVRQAWPDCPVCGEQVGILIRGYPSSELMAAAQRGEVLIGGCIIDGGDYAPTACPRCLTWLASVHAEALGGEEDEGEDAEGEQIGWEAIPWAMTTGLLRMPGRW